jgi:large subunit ribosomal protein L4
VVLRAFVEERRALPAYERKKGGQCPPYGDEMIDVPVYNPKGEQTGTLQIDEAALGGRVRLNLLKQAIASWQIHQRQGSARTKSRGMVEGSTRKLYRQKGTGNARMGSVRQPVRRGGGRAFAKGERNYRRDLPRKMKQLARNSALLAKLKSGSVAVVDGLTLDQPRTKTFYAMLKALGGEKGCVFAMDGANPVLYRSGRNIPKTDIREVHQLNAYEILRRRKLVFTRPAFEAVIANPQSYRREEAATA